MHRFIAYLGKQLSFRGLGASLLLKSARRPGKFAEHGDMRSEAICKGARDIWSGIERTRLGQVYLYSKPQASADTIKVVSDTRIIIMEVDRLVLGYSSQFGNRIANRPEFAEVLVLWFIARSPNETLT